MPHDRRHRNIQEARDFWTPCVAESAYPAAEWRLPIEEVASVARGFAALLAVGRALRPAKPHPAKRELWDAVWDAFGPEQAINRTWARFDVAAQRLELTLIVERLLNDTRVHLRLEWESEKLSAGPNLRVAAIGALATATNELCRVITSGAFDEEAQCVVCQVVFFKERKHQVLCGEEVCRRRWKSRTRQLNRERRRGVHR